MEPCLSSPPVPLHHHQLSTFHPQPPPPISLSSSSASSSSSSGGPGSSSGGSATGLNARTLIQALPPPANNMYQIHDGFATVRKRKGPTAASIAMRQQQECYDLAQPASAIMASVSNLPPKSNLNNKRQGSFMQKASFRLSSKDKKASNSPATINSNGIKPLGNGKSNGLLSTHPSLNLKQNNGSSKNGFSLIPVRKTSNQPLFSPTTIPHSSPDSNG
jgi:hypothetical protein